MKFYKKLVQINEILIQINEILVQINTHYFPCLIPSNFSIFNSNNLPANQVFID